VDNLKDDSEDIAFIELDDVVIYGFPNDYIFSEINKTGGFYESFLLKRWKKHFENSSLVLDIGANIGNHSLFMATQANCKKIISFEPLPEIFSVLQKNIAENHLDNIEPLNYAVGKERGFAEIAKTIENNCGATSLKLSEKRTDIELIALDDFFSNIPKIDFVKIDVEGFEVEVLKGMKKTISKYKPKIWLEVQKTTFLEVNEILENFGYKILDYDETRDFNLLYIYSDTNFINFDEVFSKMLNYCWKSKDLHTKNLRFKSDFFAEQKKVGDLQSQIVDVVEENERNKLNFFAEQKKVGDLQSQIVDVVEENERNKLNFFAEQKKVRDLKQRLSDVIQNYEIYRSRYRNYQIMFDQYKKQANEVFEENKKNKIHIEKSRFDLIHEKNKSNMLNKKVKSLENQLKMYKNRKVVRITDNLLKPYYYLKKGFYLIINKAYAPLKPHPKITTPIHKINKRLNLVNKEAALEAYNKYKGFSQEKKQTYSESVDNEIKQINHIKVAVIMDEFTYTCFKYEFNAIVVEPSNWLEIFKREKPDLFICESAWSGIDSELRPWRARIYSSVNWDYENRGPLLAILEYCKKNNIPTIFWNKEDPAYYDDRVHDFVDTAIKFDHIFTTAEECVQKYKDDYGHESVHCMMFAGQPKLFNPISIGERSSDIIFAGSWYYNHPKRCMEMKQIFENILDNGYNLKIYDRGYGTDDPNRIFPPEYQKFTHPSIPFKHIEKAYKESIYSLTINTVIDSRTMFARRVFELMLCNTMVLSNYSKGIYEHFGDDIIFVEENKIDITNSEEKRLKNLYNVLENHTYAKRFKQILDTINFKYKLADNFVTLYYVVENYNEIEGIFEHYNNIEYKNKKIALILSENIPNNQIKNIYYEYGNDDVLVYSLHYLLQEDEMIDNLTKYFIFADSKLETELIDKGILHFSYIEKEYGIALGKNDFTFDIYSKTNNVLFHKENFERAFNNNFIDKGIEFSVYII
jgi:FkbM family methyltransferase